MLELILKILLAIWPFVKEWLLGKPNKKSRQSQSTSVTLAKKLYLVTSSLSIVLCFYLFNRVWVITKSYEKALQKNDEYAKLIKAHPPTKDNDAASAPALSAGQPQPCSDTRRDKTNKRHLDKRVKEDYTEVIDKLRKNDDYKND